MKKAIKERKTETDKLAARILKVKKMLEEKAKELGISIPKSLPLIVAAVLQKVAEKENTSIEFLLSEIQIIKPSPSSADPVIIYRGQILVWWL